MNTNILVTQDTRYKKADGTFPIILRLSRSQSERTLPIPTGFSVPAEFWDDNKKQVKKSYTGVSSVMRLNNQIDAQKQRARDILLELEESGQLDMMPLAAVKDKITANKRSSSFFDYTAELIKELYNANRVGTARSYQGVIDVLKSYIHDRDLSFKGIPFYKKIVEKLAAAQKSGSVQAFQTILEELKRFLKAKDLSEKDVAYFTVMLNKLQTASFTHTASAFQKAANFYTHEKDLSFREITYDFLQRFESNHFKKGNAHNGLAVYMRTIRAIYNKAIKSGLIDKKYYPFEDYKIKTVPTEKRALNWELFKNIIEAKFEDDHECFHGRNFFLASFMMYGMNFTDMAFFEKSKIKDGRIKYRRRKTSKLYDIKVTDNLDKILSYYINLNPDSPYVFPIIKHGEYAQQCKDIQWARKRYNKNLKKLADECGIEENLTSYVSRHSFATQALLNDVPLAAISTMLGHSSFKTTEIYLKSLPNNVLDDYNSKILKEVG